MKGLISDEVKRKLTQRDMVRMSVGRRFWGCTIAGMPDSCTQKIPVTNWVDKTKQNLMLGNGLLLLGNYNTGKTGSAVICMKSTVMRGGTAYMIRGNSLNDAIINKTIFDDDESVYERVLSVDLLTIDDIGSGHESAWGTSVMEEVLRTRSDRRAATILTTNLSSTDLKQKFGDSLLNFLGACSAPVVCSGHNFRESERSDTRRSVQ